jgi:hypothetical protein
MVQPAENVASHISKLASVQAREREEAARELFRIGCARVEPVLRKWFADPEFRTLAPTGSALLTVGLAVEPPTFEAIRERFGRPSLAEAPADQDVLEFELAFPHGVRIDILTARTAGGDGPIARFLARFGEGIQQVECAVRNITRATDILRQRFELEPVYPQVREGANKTLVNFFLVPAEECGKVLIELVESPQKPRKS